MPFTRKVNVPVPGRDITLAEVEPSVRDKRMQLQGGTDIKGGAAMPRLWCFFSYQSLENEKSSHDELIRHNRLGLYGRLAPLCI